MIITKRIWKSNSDDNLPIKKTPELGNMIKFVRAIFHEGNEYYLQIFLDKCVNKNAVFWWNECF